MSFWRAGLSSNSVAYEEKVVRADAVMSWGGVKRHVILTLALDEANSLAYF
jgi:hypothetical protein